MAIASNDRALCSL